MSNRPLTVRPGQQVKASEYNKLVRGINALLDLRAGNGLRITGSGGGMRISLDHDAMRERMLHGVITAVNSPGGENTAQDLTLVSYDVKVYGDPRYIEFMGVNPYYGRPDINVEGQPGKVGDDCIIFRRQVPGGQPIVRMLVFNEKTIFFDCPPP